MKKITFIALTLLFSGCSSVQYAEQPSHIKETYNENGELVQEYVVGYSIEDFLKEFY
jgi:uncharacterized protein YceK